MLNRAHPARRPNRVGHFLLTVELEPAAAELSTVHHRRLADWTARLAELLNKHGLVATWAVGDPAHSAATASLLQGASGHELAILGDATWVGPTAGRTRFARELARRMAQARSAGIDVTSLVPRAASIVRHIDLVVKHGLTAIAGIAGPVGAKQRALPSALHYGVWEFPVSERLPGPASWLPGRGLVRRIRRAGRQAATFHLLIDASAVVEEGGRAQGVVARVVRRVAELRDRGLVGVETLGASAARLAHVPSASPQRSILRTA